MKKYDSAGANSGQNDAQKTKKEPNGTPTALVAGLGDTEGAKEGCCERFKKSHEAMVRVVVSEAGRILDGNGTSNRGSG